MYKLIKNNLSIQYISLVKDNLSIVEATLFFESGYKIIIAVDINTDELIIKRGKIKNNNFKLLNNRYFLVRYWEMKNNQGYSDALQLEFWDSELKNSLFIQFQALASGIELFYLTENNISEITIVENNINNKIKFNKVGKILKGYRAGWLVKIEDGPGDDAGYLIVAFSPEKDNGYDDWVSDLDALNRYFNENEWEIDWNI
jgi:hypothetical protein